MKEHPATQRGTITFYDTVNNSGIIRSKNQHYFFDAETNIPYEDRIVKNQTVTFITDLVEIKKVLFLTTAENIKSEEIQKLAETHSPAVSEQPYVEPKIEALSPINQFFSDFSAFPTNKKMIAYISILYTITAALTICCTERFTGLGLSSVLLLTFACFNGILILRSKGKPNVATILMMYLLCLAPLLSTASYEISKVSKIAFINLNSLSERKVLDHGIININHRETKANKTHRSWNNLELVRHNATKLLLFCDFINPEDTCPKLEYLHQHQVQIEYAYLRPYEVLVLSIKTSDHQVKYSNMMKGYKFQQQTIWLWLCFVLFPAIFYPIVLIRYLYRYKHVNTGL